MTASYDINYNVREDGQTQVRIAGQLFNPSQDVYISQYSLTLSIPDAENIEASDSKGKINPVIEKNANQTKITLSFNDKVVGTDRPVKFRLNYTTKKISIKSGLVWEINIPKAADFKNIKDYNVAVNIPDSLGPSIYASPKPNSIEKNVTFKIYRYDAGRLSKTGAILSFGPYQLYSFDLKYNLKNSSLLTGMTKIALPPSIFSEQEVVYNQVYPLPQNVETDADGNYLATYKLPAGQTTVITVKGKAKIVNAIRDVDKAGTFSEIPPSFNVYTRPQKYWETENVKIKQIVKEVVGEITPQSNVSVVSQKLFDYVQKTLTYDQNRVKPDLTRFGALEALNKKENAVCMEFADLLVTLTRAAGIPSQLLEGFAYTKDEGSRPAIGDVLHSWVRIYLPRLGWIAVDPTWSNTTGGLDYYSHIDTNHFIFAIKGMDSETPYPAGAYKISPDQVGDINVSVVEGETDTTLESVLTGKTSYTSSLFDRDKNMILEIANSGKGTVFGAKLSLKPGILKSPESSLDLGDIPPFGNVTKTFNITKEPPVNTPLSNVTYMNFEGKVENITLSYSPSKAKSVDGDDKNLAPTIIGILIALGLYGFVLILLRQRPDLLQ